ncbi:MAG: aldo/keto reductase [Gammaproteobacteria bacterium]|jgi:alcohol dehydrogenase (NADP+)|nr:aldehyde oxidoreductase [Gammaproteobacteria bacterium]MDP6095766.1 aldo/keto reductase [Gammaproteobacteria bacterium]HJO12593.1 aldo/keto reductase [Gammaproteobacteria bacterium]|tara:strand:- start:8182 stop:9135 length:954 start_codon:yes stop_codon:yes gene_type:complete
MEYLTLSSGDRLPMLGLGTWKAEPGAVYKAVRQAIQIGYRHFDCAAIYGNEGEIGKALADATASGDVDREALWVSSKLWNNSHLQADVRPALEQSLSDLQLDYLDLYIIHWPVAFKPGVSFPQSAEEYFSLEEVPISETWGALELCVDRGLARNIGVSNFSVPKLRSLLQHSKIKPTVNQVEMHPALCQHKLKKFCDDNAVAVTAYSPLGSRDRATAFKSKKEPDLLALEAVREIAELRGITPAQVLLAWAVNRGTAVIPKSTNPDRLKLNFDSVIIELTPAEIDRINQSDRNYRFINGAFFTSKGSPYTVGGIWDQ